MSWLFFAILSPAIYAIINFVDKYILEKEIKDYQGMPVFSAIMAFVFGTIFWVLTGFQILSFQDSLIVLFTGMLAVWSLYFYFKALSNEETSIIIILFQITPVIVWLLSFTFLGERISSTQLVGFFLILFSTIAVSIRKDQKLFSWNSSIALILIYDLFWGLSYVLFKFVSEGNSFSKLVVYESWGITLGGIVMYLLFPGIRNAFNKSLKTVKKKTLSFIFLNEGFFVLAKLMSFFAISLGPVTLVSVMGSTQVFFGIIYGYVLSMFFPKIFKEKSSAKELTKKAFFASLVCVGIYLVG